MEYQFHVGIFDIAVPVMVGNEEKTIKGGRMNELKTLMDNYIKNDEKLSEKNKENNQIEWVKLMNNYKNSVEEIILKELIYV